MKTVFQYVVTFFCYMLIVASLFVMLVGIVNGFGTPDLTHRVTITLIGLGLFLLSVGTMYIVNGKNVEKMQDRFFDLVFYGSFWK